MFVFSQQLRTHHFFELRKQEQVLKFSLKNETYCLGRDTAWSSFRVPDRGWEALSRKHAVFKKEGNSYRLFDGDGTSPSLNGIFLNQTRINCQKGILLQPNLELHIGKDTRKLIVLTYLDSSRKSNYLPAKDTLVNLAQVQEWPIVLGRVKSIHGTFVFLDAPTVSRHHAVIQRDSRGNYLLQDNSTNGTIHNQKRIQSTVKLKEGDRIRIGPYQFQFRQQALENCTSSEVVW